MLVSWHCFPLQVHFKLGNLLFFYTGTFLQKWQKWLHKPHFELWNPYCMTSFEILQNNDPYNIQGLSPLCYKVPVGSRWLPRPAPCGLFLKDSHCHAPAHAFSEGGQISPHMDSTRKVHMKRKNQKYSTEPKSQHFFQDLNLIPSFCKYAWKGIAWKTRLHCSKRCLLLFKQSLFNNTYSHLCIFNRSIIFVICCNE